MHMRPWEERQASVSTLIQTCGEFGFTLFIFDTETTCLPKKGSSVNGKWDNNARLFKPTYTADGATSSVAIGEDRPVLTVACGLYIDVDGVQDVFAMIDDAESVRRFVAIMRECDVLVAHNLNFDLAVMGDAEIHIDGRDAEEVLSEYRALRVRGFDTCDVARRCTDPLGNSTQHRRLGQIAELNRLCGKSASGVDAVEWWQRYKDVDDETVSKNLVEYCCQDVDILVEFLVANRLILHCVYGQRADWYMTFDMHLALTRVVTTRREQSQKATLSEEVSDRIVHDIVRVICRTEDLDDMRTYLQQFEEAHRIEQAAGSAT